MFVLTRSFRRENKAPPICGQRARDGCRFRPPLSPEQTQDVVSMLGTDYARLGSLSSLCLKTTGTCFTF